MSEDLDQFKVLRNIQKNPKKNQREHAENLGFSLGKLNYLLKALQKKGLVKIQNFQKSKKKLNYMYILTPKGIAEKTKITIDFMKRISKEYNQLKKELKKKNN